MKKFEPLIITKEYKKTLERILLKPSKPCKCDKSYPKFPSRPRKFGRFW